MDHGETDWLQINKGDKVVYIPLLILSIYAKYILRKLDCKKMSMILKLQKETSIDFAVLIAEKQIVCKF